MRLYISILGTPSVAVSIRLTVAPGALTPVADVGGAVSASYWQTAVLDSVHDLIRHDTLAKSLVFSMQHTPLHKPTVDEPMRLYVKVR